MAFSFFKKSDKGAKKEEIHTGPKYYDLTVKDIIQETKDAISIVFETPAEGSIKYKSGQFLTYYHLSKGQGNPTSLFSVFIAVCR
jgi:ring-1,2-phenylacetyl-CoA epoxidase subunit PaaE